MDRRLLRNYNRELQHLRDVGGEFAREFPKIAGRLSLDEFACGDPYVERLLEGFAFLAARIQVKYESEFPHFTQAVLETVYPHYLAPTPSMSIVAFEPDMTDKALADGLTIPRGETLQSLLGKGERTACEYRTAHDVTLWPIRVESAAYYTREVRTLELPDSLNARAALRIRLRAGADLAINAVKTDRLVFCLRGTGDMPFRIYEQVFGHATGVVLRDAEQHNAKSHVLSRDALGRVGFDDGEALLPFGARSFQGYRLLHEYFAFPQRYLFVSVEGMGAAMRACEGGSLDLVIALDDVDLEMEQRVDASHFVLYCTPAVNLFPKRLDRIQLSDRFHEYHLVPDRTRPMDFEVHHVTDVIGYGASSGYEQRFRPFYASTDLDPTMEEGGAYYTVNREPRLMSSREKLQGRRSSYAGSEVFLQLVDAKAAPFVSDLQQLSVTALCSNRDLPLMMPTGRGGTDFALRTSAPVVAVRCVAGPTSPRASHAEGEFTWRAISHLSLNYLSLLDHPGGEGAKALRDLLRLYGDARDPQVRKQIEGVLSATSAPVTRRLPGRGPVTFARGLEIGVTMDEDGFEGTGVFLLGAVLDCFFAKYVSINSFTETKVMSRQRGEIMRWPMRLGLRHLL